MYVGSEGGGGGNQSCPLCGVYDGITSCPGAGDDGNGKAGEWYVYIGDCVGSG